MLLDVFESEHGMLILGKLPDTVTAISDGCSNYFSLVILNMIGRSDLKMVPEYMRVMEPLCKKGCVVYVFTDSHYGYRPAHELISTTESESRWTFKDMTGFDSGSKEIVRFSLLNKNKNVDSIKKGIVARPRNWTTISRLMGAIRAKYGVDKVFESLVMSFTRPGEWILDPLSRNGLVAEIAVKTGRRFVCIEGDCEEFCTAISRIEKIT